MRPPPGRRCRGARSRRSRSRPAGPRGARPSTRRAAARTPAPTRSSRRARTAAARTGSSSARSRSRRRSPAARARAGWRRSCSTPARRRAISGAVPRLRVNGEHEPPSARRVLGAPERDHRRAARARLARRPAQRHAHSADPQPRHVAAHDGRARRRPLHHVLRDADDQPVAGMRSGRRERSDEHDKGEPGPQGLSLPRAILEGGRPALNGPNGLSRQARAEVRLRLRRSHDDFGGRSCVPKRAAPAQVGRGGEVSGVYFVLFTARRASARRTQRRRVAGRGRAGRAGPSSGRVPALRPGSGLDRRVTPSAHRRCCRAPAGMRSGRCARRGCPGHGQHPSE